MRVNLLNYTWKGISTYSWAYILITNQYNLNDIIESRKSGKKIVLFGWIPTSYGAIQALHNSPAGNIKIDLVADFSYQEESNINVGNGLRLVNFRKLVAEQDNYYFILYAENFGRITEMAKLLQYNGIDEFGIIQQNFTKDFSGNKKLQNAFFDSINEVFMNVSLLNNWDVFSNCSRAALTGAGYWDMPYMLISKLYKNSKNTSYLEVGPGIGIMSLSLKKVLDIDETWITIPNEEKLWAEWRKPESIKLIKDKYHINIIEGYIETDEFSGLENRYDVIVLAQVMEHFIFNPVNTLKKLARMLKKNGKIFISVPEEVKRYNVISYRDMPNPEDLSESERLRRQMINNFEHFQEYTYQEAADAFEDAGLEVIVHCFNSPIHHFMLERKV